MRRLTGRSGRVELFVAFDDPNSAVALVELERRLRRREVELAVFPVLERDMEDDPAIEAKRTYAVSDASRLAARSGLALSRREPIPAAEVTFLAEWVASAGDSVEVTRFAVEAARLLWLDGGDAMSDSAAPAEVDREAFIDLWRRTVGGAPGDVNASAVDSNQRRMKRRGAYAVPMAWVHGRLYFAHDRLDSIEDELDSLGWTASDGKKPGAEGPPPVKPPTTVARPATVDFYFSYRSPYSYLGAPRAFALRDAFDIDLRFHGVTPMAMRGQSVPQAKRLHTIRDVGREAARLGMQFGPVWDPIGEGAERCLAIGVLAADRGRDREWVLAVSRAIWAEEADVTDDSALRPICERAGLDWDECSAAMRDPAIAARVKADTDRLVAMGQWGVPVLVFEGEPFWGQDRIADLESLLAASGLAKR